MPDVFISYARSSAPQAEAVAEGLRAVGYAVWRDDELPAHRAYAEAIEDQLRSAKAVVVIWSADAVKSQWVRAEADVAREAGTLVQVSIDRTTPPLPFNQIQCADLHAWSGDTTSVGWRQMLAGVRSLVDARPDSRRLKEATAAPTPPTKPSIAVLPFRNMSDDREQEFLADGMTEDIITGLSLSRSLFVIARNSTFNYKGRTPDVRDVGRELGVRNVLEGSVRRMGAALRVTAQLIDARTGAHVWAQTLDRPLVDIFKMQDEITSAIVAALTAHFTHSVPPEVARARPDSLEAWELCQRARALVNGNLDAAGRTTAEALLRKAVKKDPTYAVAWTSLGVVIAYRWIVEPTVTAPVDLDEARACLERGAALAPMDADVLADQGHFLIIAGRPKDAVSYLQRAKDLNPNEVLYRMQLSRSLGYAGQPAQALTEMETVLRLSPNDPLAANFAYQIAFFNFALGHYAESESWARRSQAGSGRSLRTQLLLAVAIAAQDRIDEARRVVREALQVSPQTSLASQEALYRNLGLDEALLAERMKFLSLAWPSDPT